MTRRVLAAAIAACALPAHAGDFISLGSLAQGEFRRLSEDLGAAFSYKGVTPAKRLGPGSFDVGVEITATQLENSSFFSKAGAGSADIVVPKVHVNAGFFGGVDVGAFIGGSTDLDATLVGVDLRFALLEDTLTTPAVALRASGTRTNGMAIRVGTVAGDVMVSKTFTLLTPYAGAGVARVQAKARGVPLQEETFNRGRVFGGLNVNLVGVNFALEAEKMGDNMSYSAKLGLRF